MRNGNQKGDNNKNSKRRVRGITASRAKLDKAMVNAGFSGQIDIARKIAENEGLNENQIPRDMVNRVFSVKPVDSKSIERVAQALGVEAYELYLNAKDQEILEANPPATSSTSNNFIQPPDPSKNTLYLVLAVMLILSISSVVVYINISSSATDTELSSTSASRDFEMLAPNSVASVVIHAEAQWPIAEPEVEIGLLGTDKVTFDKSEISKIQDNPDVWKLPEQLETDFVLHLQAERKGRQTELRAHLISQSKKRLIFADVYPTSSIDDRREEIYSQIKIVLSNVLNLENDDIPNIDNIPYNEEAVDAILKGRMVLEGASVRDSLAVAMIHYQRAIGLAPNYLQAKVSLCNSLVGMYLLYQTAEALSDANRVCDELLAAASDNVEYQLAISTLKRTQRTLTEAKQWVDKAIALSPNNVDGLLVSAETELRLLLQNQDRVHFENALALTKKAIEIEPDYWKSYFVQGRVYYFAGQPQKSIELTEKSVSLNENYSNLTNLGTMNFCFGDIDKTRELYLRAKELDYAGVMVSYNLATIYDFFEEQELAAAEATNYLNSLTLDGSRGQLESLIGISGMFAAIKNYEKAEDLLQKAFIGIEALLRKSPDAADLQLLQLHSEIGLAEIDTVNGEYVDPSPFVERLKELEKINRDPTSQVRVMLLYIALGDLQSAREIYPKVAPVCKGFAESPELKRALF